VVGDTSKRAVKLSIPALVLGVVSAIFAFAQVQPNEPTKEEIEQAYRSKSGEGGMFVPGLRWERWRIKEIRSWKLHFKRISEERSAGVLTLKYRAVAKKNGSCAEYEITDAFPFPPNYLKPILVVNPGGLSTCR
jgi:hypothetical protein